MPNSMGECMNFALRGANHPDFDFKIPTILAEHSARTNIRYALTRMPPNPSSKVTDFTIQHGTGLSAAFYEEQSAFITAAILDHEQLCTLAIYQNPNPTEDRIGITDSYGCTPLHIATGGESAAICKLLIASGAPIHATDIYGMTPLLEAVYHGHLEAVQLLLANGACPDDVTCPKDTASVTYTRTLLIEPDRLKGAWRERRNLAAQFFRDKRRAAVHIAAHRGFTDVLQELINAGADLTVVDVNASTALDVALKDSNLAIALQLLVLNCPFNAGSKRTSKLLREAIETENQDAVKKLSALGILQEHRDTSQEQLLSPRVLYFGNGELYWDCVTTSASESSPIAASLIHNNDPDETWGLKLIRRTLAGSTDVHTLRSNVAELWTQIIKNYSSRNLTKLSDKLIALEGILKPLTEILKDQPAAGMWRDQLWRQLIWWIDAPSSKFPTGPASTFEAPSWSWLSVTNPVYYHNAVRTNDAQKDHAAHKFTDLALFSKIISVESKESPGASSIHGTLTVAGPSFRYRLTVNDLKKFIFKSWNAAKLRLNTGRWMLDRAFDLPLDLECVIVAEDTVAKMLVCLCFVQHEERPGMWRRVGLCHWDGLAWQVRKCVGADPLEKEFVVV
ncbi:ankyrin [Decorospora gaudefroyi]|uniref:Ankyrin n=1 Tax=Decorospora gaudefroyi TaxID=184978 RepID=A0A6A5KQ61_9PLEO|nr:ankyrin [Decorospora gaudefroyi]